MYKLRFILMVLVILLATGSSNVSYALFSDYDKSAILRDLEWLPDDVGDNDACFAGASSAGEPNINIAWNYFLSKGLTPEQTAGVLGNLIIESQKNGDKNIHPDNVQDGKGYEDGYYDPTTLPKGVGYGIAQWTDIVRKKIFKGFADATNRRYDSLELQLDLIWFELTGEPETPGVTGGTEATAYALLKNTSTVEDATKIFARKYERNATSIAYDDGLISEEIAFGARISAAEYVISTFSGRAVSAYSCEFKIIVGDTADIPCDPNSLNQSVVDGYKDGKLYRIRVCQIPLYNGDPGPVVNSQISTAVYNLIQDAGKDGTYLSGGGFRTMEQQIEARKRNGCPDIYTSPASDCKVPTARPGFSNHQMGLAIDFAGIPQCPTSITTANGKRFCQAPDNDDWVWLNYNAGSYGLHQLRTEAWHWSVDGR